MTGASFLKVFQDLDKRKEGQIIIDCETERLTGILKEIVEQGKNAKSYHYILANLARNRFTHVETASLLGTFLEHRVRLQGSRES
ncbi:hypothetical protein CRENBAI_004079 [Crenichthys baileyi]|uniref:Receptor ligand binding region domain-containing protein n=1 Tax=Crenichthys baileyi TaxID=28760 RepID=A0AAV9SCD0_9TELE